VTQFIYIPCKNECYRFFKGYENGKKQINGIGRSLFPIKKNADDFEIWDIPPEQRVLHTETYDFSVGTVYEYLKKGDIFIPDFQRLYVWNRSQASDLLNPLLSNVQSQ